MGILGVRLDPEAKCDISVSKLLGFKTFVFFWMVSDPVLKKIGIEKSIGFGIVKIWFRKKYQIRYRKKFWIWFRLVFGYFR